MAQTRETGPAGSLPPGVTMVVVPDEHVDQVLKYISGLQQEKSQVAGYVFGATPTMKKPFSTGCTYTGLMGDPPRYTDMYCLDPS